MAGSVQVVPRLLYMLDVQLVTGSVLLLWRLPWYCFTDWLWQKAWPPVRGSLGLPNTLCTSAQRQSCSSKREGGGLPNRAPHIRQLRCRDVPVLAAASEFHRQLEVEYLSRDVQDSEGDVGLQP